MKIFRYCDFNELKQLVEKGNVTPYKTQTNIIPIYFNQQNKPIEICLNMLRSQLEEIDGKLFTEKGYNINQVKWVRYEGRIGCPEEILKYLRLKLNYKR